MQYSPAVFIDENTNEVNLGIKGFNIFPYTKVVEFEEMTEAFNYFLSQHFSRESVSDKKKSIEKHLERELKKVTNRLNDIKARTERGSKENEYKNLVSLF
jgi:predicted ribosome quality control (RQC) complex YloA/Tae2 family protein